MKRPIVVMKFGGTSVADPEKIHRAAERAIAARAKGRGVIVVISAPGEMTNELTGLARRVVSEPEGREFDQLIATGEQVGISLFAMSCLERGVPAISLTGPQAGIEAGGRHTRAHIVRIRTGKILSELGRGRIVAVAGFQASTPSADVTTLGRGGSDLTAIALASRFKAADCEIYSDVKGVYTADPRIVPDARKLRSITFDEMLELTGAGAQVMQARSLEMAARFGISFHVRSAFHTQTGTFIVKRKQEKRMMEKAYVSSLALDKGEVRLTVAGVPDRPGIAALVLSALAEAEVPVDMIIQSAPRAPGFNDISLMTPRASAERARKSLAGVARKLKARIEINDHVAKISAVGMGFKSHPLIAARMFKALSRGRINIHMIVASDMRISCVVDSRHGETAVKLLHKAYGLGKRR